MKRAVCLIIALMLVLTCACAQATASYGEHTHKWVDSGDRRDPTCTETGVAYEYCSICQAYRERTLPALGHHFPPEKWEITKQPTCTEPGQEMNHCTRVNYGQVCGYEWRRELPALGHDWGEWYVVKPAQPGEPGLEERKCGRCDSTEQRPIYEEWDMDKLAITLSVTIPDEKPTYLDGENIAYVYEVTNVSDRPLYIKWVYHVNPDGSNGADLDSRGVTINAGETLFFYDDVYQVTKNDVESFAPSFSREFKVQAYPSAADSNDWKKEVKNNGTVFVTTHIGDAELKAQLLLSASLKNPQPSYSEGERAYFDVSVTNNSDEAFSFNDFWYKTPSGDRVYDWYILSLEAGETQTYETFYDLKEEDIELSAEEIRLEFQCNGWPTRLTLTSDEGPLIYSNIDAVPVPLGEEGEDIGDMELVVEKTIKGVTEDEAYPSYTEGEVVTFVVSAHNSQSYPLYDVVITDKDSAGNSVILGSWEVFEGGANVEFEYTHTISWADCEASTYENTVTGEWYSNENDRDAGEDKNLIDDTVTVETWLEPSDMELNVTKTEISAPLNGSYYTEGEILVCQIDVWNSQGYPLYNVTVDDRDKEGILPLYAGELKPHQSLSFTVSHSIDAEDCKNGYYENTAYGRWTEEPDYESEIFEVSDIVTVPCEAPSGLTVVKQETSMPANGLYYVEGETVWYSVTITNNTKLYLYKLTLDDELLPGGTVFDELKAPLAPGASVTVEYSFTVKDIYVMMGKIFNLAFVTADGYITNDIHSKLMKRFAVESNEVTVPTGKYPDDVVPGTVELTKYLMGGPANGAYYEVGEPIIFVVNIDNHCDYPITDAYVYDPILGEGEDAMLDETELTLQPNDGRGYFVTYIPTQEDADNGFVVNVAEGSYYDSVADKRVSIVSNAVTVDVGKAKGAPQLSLMKYVANAPANGAFYQEGETITYRFILTNNSNVPVYSVGIYDPLNVVGGEIAPVYKTTTLAPYGTLEAYFSYIVTHEDIENLTDIINQGLAEYYPDPDGEDYTIFSNTVITPIGKELPPEPELPYINMTVTKTAVNPPANGQWYVEGEQVVFLITFSNTGDVPLYLAAYSDDLVNSFGYSRSTVELNDMEVAPHSSASFSYPCTVTKQDVESGWLRNEVVFWAWCKVEPSDYMDFFPGDAVTVVTGPGEPELLEYPVAYKYEVSTPLNGYAYTEGEWVEYDIVLCNGTGRTFTDVESYDILLTDVGFYLNYDGTLSSAPIVEHVAYKATADDVLMGDIYNTAWFTMTDEDGSSVTVTSNEVIVDTTSAPPPPPHTVSGKMSCEYRIVAEGEGAATYKNDYCFEHASLQKRVNEKLLAANTPQELGRAWSNAAELWQKSMNSLYTRQIDAAQGEKKTALENDLSMLNAYLSAYRARLEAEGASSIEINKALTNVARDRTCEMCYCFGHAPETREDLSGQAAFEQQRQSAPRCEVNFEAYGSSFYTKHLNVCDSHQALVKAQSRVLQTAGEDESLRAIAWDKANALWQTALDGTFNQSSGKADALLKHQLLKEQAAFNAFVKTHMRVYAIMYPDDEVVVKELAAALRYQKVLEMCR